MLELIIKGDEYWDEVKEEFVCINNVVLQLEHSLVSVSKWESKWRKPFLSKTEKTVEESVDYIRYMTITPNVDASVYNRIGDEHIVKVSEYIEDPMTATVVSDTTNSKVGSSEFVTAELIYYWMTALNIPHEYETWHLNKLLTFIKVCNIKNSPPKKMSQQEVMRRNAALNAKRRQQLNSKG